MFKLLGNKIKYITIPIVGILLALLFIIVYLSVSQAILSDFTSKSLGFSKQIAKSFDLELKRVEQSVDFFINTKFDKNTLTNDVSLLHNQILGDIKGLNSNIIGAFILQENDAIYATNSYYIDVAKYIVNEKTIKKPLWKVIDLSKNKYISNKKNMFIYVMPLITNENDKNAILCVDVSFLPLFSNVDTNNIFLEGASICISSGNDKIVLKGNKNIDNVEINSYAFTSDRKLCYKNQIEGNIYSMEFKLAFSDIYHRMNVIKTIFIALWLIIMALFFLAISKFYNVLSNMLTNLNDKIMKYVENKK